ncbi:MAG: hypothetical protein ACI8TA_002238 [Cyclobacteriaceae bacterium]|jgi:hypothetical protein
MRDYSKVTTFDKLLEVEHGSIGAESRNDY